MGIRAPAYDAPRAGHEGESLWAFAHRLVHVENEAGRIKLPARLPMIVLTLALAVVAWRWTRALAGPLAGLLALALLAFHPSLIAHGHLVGSDLPASSCFLAASFSLWRWTSAPSLARAATTAALVGLALATKLSAVLLVPALALVVVLELVARRRPDARLPARELAVLAIAAVLLAPAVVWAAYGFRAAASPDGTPAFSAAGLLPEAYLEGARRFAAVTSEGRSSSYLLGQTSTTGFRHYFLVAFLAKNTPGFLIALAAACVAAARGGAARPALAHLTVPPALVFAAASLGAVQIGERYVLPVYGYLTVFIGTQVPSLLGTRWGRIALAAALAAHVGPALAQAPHGELAYFNALAGGQRGGHRVLADSNLDWGQDLPRLARWMDANGVDRVQLGYFGHDDPLRLGIRHKDLPGNHSCAAGPPGRPFRGVVAVSPSLLFSNLPAGDPYGFLRPREPDARAGVYFIYRFPE